MVPGSESFRLVMRRGPNPNQVYDLSKDNVTIGRDITNEIVINDPEVSRHHLRFTRGGDGFIMQDLGSTNGTFINGQRMTGSRPLRPGDMIGLGETVTLAYETLSGATVVGAPADPASGATLQSPSTRAEASAPGVSQPFGPGASQPYQPGVPPGASQGYPPAAPTTVQPYAPPPTGGTQQQYAPQPSAPQPPAPTGGTYGYPPASTGYTAGQVPYGGTAAQPPGATGYGEYDPYAAGEVAQSNTTRIVAIGCAALTVFCCCGSLAGAVIIDQLCLYQSVPFVYSIIRALGYVAVCP